MQLKPNSTTRIKNQTKCNASRECLGAALEQLEYKTVYSPLDFMFIWVQREYQRAKTFGAEIGCPTLHGFSFEKIFAVITWHRAIRWKMKEHRSNKSYNGRITRSIDCILP